jgi:hypothetical protein
MLAMNKSVRESKVKVVVGLLATGYLAACAGANKPAPESAESAEGKPSDEEIVAHMKGELGGVLCTNAGLRSCLGIPDEAACMAGVDEAWPSCDDGFVNLNEGDAAHWRKVGQDTAACLIHGLEAKYPAGAESVSDMKACVSASMTANASQ